jgi:hypothetical protein
MSRPCTSSRPTSTVPSSCDTLHPEGPQSAPFGPEGPLAAPARPLKRSERQQLRAPSTTQSGNRASLDPIEKARRAPTGNPTPLRAKVNRNTRNSLALQVSQLERRRSRTRPVIGSSPVRWAFGSAHRQPAGQVQGFGRTGHTLRAWWGDSTGYNSEVTFGVSGRWRAEHGESTYARAA